MNKRIEKYNYEVYATSVATTIQGLHNLFSNPRPVDSWRGSVVFFHKII